MIEQSLALIAGCKTVNQLNQVHIGLENILAPLEVRDLQLALADRVQRHSAPRRDLGTPPAQGDHFDGYELSNRWILRLQDILVRAGGPALPFQRRTLREGISIYSSGGDRRGKTLLIGFTGNAHRLMMPISVFLQQLDARAVDMVRLTTEKNCAYRNGICGIEGELEAGIAALDELLAIRDYRSAAIIGTSGGGLPAILAGLFLGLDVLAVGASSPDDPRWVAYLDSRGESSRDFFQGFARAGCRAPDIHLVYGVRREKDGRSAEAIASHLPVRTITPIPDAHHGALFPLVERGEFRDLLRSTILRNCGDPPESNRTASLG